MGVSIINILLNTFDVCDVGNSFYSFQSGSAFMIALNSYAESDVLSAQYQWLVRTLAAVNRSLTPWVIIMMHCPWYNSNALHRSEWQATIMQDNLEEVFYQHHVNIVFQGHVHAYERRCVLLDSHRFCHNTNILYICCYCCTTVPQYYVLMIIRFYSCMCLFLCTTMPY